MTAGRRHGWRALQIAVTLGLAGLLIWLVDWVSVLRVLRSVNSWWVAAVIVLVFLERLLLNIKWQALLHSGGIEIGFLPLLRIQLAANALGTFLPSSIGVDALRIAGLWSFGDRRHAAVAATLLDRISSAGATVVVSGAMVLLFAGTLMHETVRMELLGLCVVLVLGMAFLFHPFGRGMVRRMVRMLPVRIHQRVIDIGAAGLTIAVSRRSIVVATTTSLLAVGLRVVIGKFLLLAVGVNVPLATLSFVLPVVWATTMLPISIGGIGVQDATYVALLGYAGIGASVAIVVSLLDHVLSRVPLLLGVLFWRDVVPVGTREA